MTNATKKPARKQKTSKAPDASGSLEARKTVGLLLEVLAGTLSPSDAASLLGISTPRYYMVESRALQGMLEACEPRKRGYVRSAEKELELLQKKYEQLQRERDRYQALVRAAQRTVGIGPQRRKMEAKKQEKKKGKRRRKPTVRALKLAERVKRGGGDHEPGKTAEGREHGGEPGRVAASEEKAGGGA